MAAVFATRAPARARQTASDVLADSNPYTARICEHDASYQDVAAAQEVDLAFGPRGGVKRADVATSYEHTSPIRADTFCCDGRPRVMCGVSQRSTVIRPPVIWMASIAVPMERANPSELYSDALLGNAAGACRLCPAPPSEN